MPSDTNQKSTSSTSHPACMMCGRPSVGHDEKSDTEDVSDAVEVNDDGYCDDCAPDNPEGEPQRDNPDQCGCPNCQRPRHHDMSICMKCYHNDCDPYDKYGVECDDW